MYYLAASGVSSGRFLQAFPEAKALDVAKASALDASSLIWCFISDENDVQNLSGRIGAARVIALSNQPNAQQAFNVFKAGVHGYCHAQSSPAMFQQVAAVVGSGGIWVGAEFMPYLLRGVGDTLGTHADQQPTVDLSALTARELEVVEQVCTGASNKEVAANLGITERTVKAHLTAVFEKLNIRDRVQLVIQLKPEFSK